jgi:class 3 adenylate cyclase
MFADIAGFTAMSEKIDAEEVTVIMNDCFGMMGKVIERHGGTIDKFIGDCIMVLFGLPVALEDAPKRAINCAIEMRENLQNFSAERALEIPLGLHIGINTGEVVFGEMGSEQKKQYTVMGDAVNLASRLEEVSEKGEIIVGSLTHRATNRDFEYKDLKPVTVKGKSEPIPVFQLLSVKQQAHLDRVASVRKIHSEMIGREAELEELEGVVQKVIEGQGSVVCVVGEAGIGKSRLFAELRNSDKIKRVLLLQGRANSLGQNLSFHPLVDLFRVWAGMEEEEKDEEASRKLSRLIKDIIPEEFSEVFPFLAIVMGIKLKGEHLQRVEGIEGEALSQLILKAMKSLMIKASGQSPVVMRLEDMQWSDQSSIELLVALFRLAHKHRIVFINVFRPKYADTGEKLIEAVRDEHAEKSTIITLNALDNNQSIQLVNNLLKIEGLPARIRQQIITRSEGNPFFIEEVVRSFIDEGAVELRKNRFAVTTKIDSVVIPETVNEVIMGRIDRLEEDTRNLLKIASVIGRTFFFRILSEVAKSVGGLEERIDYLKGVEILRERQTKEETEYLFKHALAHDAIYNSILFQKRKELHLSVAETIEKVFMERLREFYGMLAYHYSQGEHLDKAENYLINAGQSALESAASSEALNYYNKALDLYMRKSGNNVDPGKLLMLEENIALAYYNKGHYAEAVNHFNKALEHIGEKPGKSSFAFGDQGGFQHTEYRENPLFAVKKKKARS